MTHKLITRTILAVSFLVGNAQTPDVFAFQDSSETNRIDNDVQLDANVGWYQITPQHHCLVTWGASGGLVILDFDKQKFAKLVPQEDSSFLWNIGSDSPKRRVVFERDEKGLATGFHWRGGDDDLGQGKVDREYGYDQKEVRFKNGEVQLTGLLMLPRSKVKHPAAVVIQGSGDSDRSNIWAFAIADHLARHGIAMLVTDKRGCGKSTGDWHHADFDALANDTIAGVRFLRGEPRVDSSRIGVLGLSQGGWIAPLAAAQDKKNIAFVVNLCGAAVTPGEQVTHEVEQNWRQHSAPEKYIAEALELLKLDQEYVRTGQWEPYAEKRKELGAGLLSKAYESFPTDKDHWYWDWWKGVIDFDPIPIWQELRVPALVVYGEEDEKDNVPVAESVSRLQKVASNSDSDLTVKVFADTGHALFDQQTKWLRGDIMQLVTNWISDRVR